MMSPGLTPVTAGAVTAPFLHTAPSYHWDYQVPLDTYLLQQGLEGQGKQLGAQHLSIQGFQDFQGSAESSPPKVLGTQGGTVPMNVPADRQARDR